MNAYFGKSLAVKSLSPGTKMICECLAILSNVEIILTKFFMCAEKALPVISYLDKNVAIISSQFNRNQISIIS